MGGWTNKGLALFAGWAHVLLPLVSVGAGCALLFDRRTRNEDDEEGSTGADPWRLAVGIVLGLLGICGLAEVAKGRHASRTRAR